MRFVCMVRSVRAIRAVWAFSIASVLALAGCSLNTDPPEGAVVCTTSAECPSTWVCRANSRCYRTDDGVVADGGADAGDATTPPPPDGGDGGRDAGIDAWVPECTGDGDCIDPDSDPCTGVPSCVANQCVDGSPIDCTDTIGCTVDTCLSADGSCQHTPNDALCGTGEVCRLDFDGCAPAAACTSSAMCADDGLYCTGVEDCVGGFCGSSGDPCVDANNCTMDTCNEGTDACSNTPYTFATDIDHCGTGTNNCVRCSDPTPGMGLVRACNAGACGFACELGRVDVDMNPGNGCECTIMGGIDVPDDAGADTNCDGIDGDRTRAIFVTTGGTDANDGTAPTRAVTFPRAAALFMPGVRDQILVANGTYSMTGAFVLTNGMHIHGGYATDFRTRGPTGANVLVSAPTALTATGITMPTLVERVSWGTPNRSPGATVTSAITVIVDSSDMLTLRQLQILAGAGAPGADGAQGSPGAMGQSGGNGGNSTAAGGGTGGAAGTFVTRGGAGGNGGMYGNGVAGGSGVTGSCPSGGSSGLGGGAGSCSAPGATGGNGTGGCTGTAGANAFAGGGTGTVFGGTWVATTGGTGAAGGIGAAGGGGGGGGGLVCSTMGVTAMGGGGGGGGGGGDGGAGGSGGTGGGASIGILVISSQVTLEGVTVTTSSGGTGGAGGRPGTGGPGGSGGSGGLGYAAGGAIPSAGRGGNGGPGGDGGPGGCGGGGGGGPSVPIYGNDSGAARVRLIGGTSLVPGSGGGGGAVSCTGGFAGNPGLSAMMQGVAAF